MAARRSVPTGLWVAGVLLALAAQAWFSSPLQMLVLGAPFGGVVLAWRAISAWSERDTAAPPAGQRKSRLLMLALGLLTAALVAAAFVICWQRFTDSGFVAWLDAVQARQDGRYSERLSLIVAVCDLILAYGLGIALLIRLAPAPADSPLGAGTRPESASVPQGPAGGAGPRRSAPAPVAMTRPQASPAGRGGWLWLLGTLALVWIVGGAVYAGSAWQHRQEGQASYAPLDAAHAAGVGAAAAYLALAGHAHPGGFVSLQHGQESSRTYFVPMLGRDAAPDAPARWVVRAEGRERPEFESPVLVHRAGSPVPPAVRDALARMGVQVAADAELVDHVPSRQGVVMDRDGQSFELYVGVAGFVSILLLLAAAYFALQGLRARRRQRAAALA